MPVIVPQRVLRDVGDKDRMADIGGRPSKAGADAHRGRCLSAGHPFEAFEALFRVAGGVSGYDRDEIDAVEAEADDVEPGRTGRLQAKRETHGRMLAADRPFRLSLPPRSGVKILGLSAFESHSVAW